MSVSLSRKPLLVLKVGGGIGGIEGALADLPAVLADQGYRAALVHGGGPAVTRWMERLDLSVTFKNGLRVTDAATLEVATMVLRGAVNTSLVRALAARGVVAVGLSGVDGGLLRAVPHADPDLGYVGTAGTVQRTLVDAVLDAGMVPVIAPLALDDQYQLRNVNADTVCGALAGALEASVTVFLTDVPGVLDGKGHLQPVLDAAKIATMIASGEIAGGMLPKVHACLDALRYGARAVWIADGRASGVLASIIAGETTHGTIITAG